MSKTKIPWTEFTLNPLVGCTKASIGCLHCYAVRMAARLANMGIYKYQQVVKKVGDKYIAEWNSKTYFDESCLQIPLKRKKPTMFFVSSMGDLFHESVSFGDIRKIFITIYSTGKHTYQLLTKRLERALEFWKWFEQNNKVDGKVYDLSLLQNLWLGVTVENQEMADKRIPILLQIPAAKRFVSIEPMLSKINIEKYLHCGISWCIIGAESGPNARPMNEEWVRNLIWQCKTNINVPVFYKQKRVGNQMIKMPILDGKEYKEMPK